MQESGLCWVWEVDWGVGVPTRSYDVLHRQQTRRGACWRGCRVSGGLENAS